MQSVSLSEWVSLAVGLIGLVSAYLQSKNKLPKEAVPWLKKIGDANITEAIDKAEKITKLSADEKRVEAVAYLQKLAEKKLGVPIPDSIANFLVENGYQAYKRITK